MARSAPEKAARLWGAADALREVLGVPPLGLERTIAAFQNVRSVLGETVFAAAWDAGRRLNWSKTADYALGAVDN